MFEVIQKRDGCQTSFDESKITDAIFKAARAVGGEDRTRAIELTLKVLKVLKSKYNGQVFGVEEVQDIVEKVLIEQGHASTAKVYILYRDKRTRMRESKSDLMDVVAEILTETDKENANVSNSPSAKMLQIAGAASKRYYLGRLIPEEMANAHIKGDIHIHDLDWYGKTLTCLQVPLGRLLKEGFNTGHGYIRPPKRPNSATALTAIILQSSQNDMHGGQSYAAFDRDMAEFVTDADDKEIYQAMEALVYNLNSMHSRAGAQVPFSSINLGTVTSETGRAITKNLLLAFEAGLGRGENPIFPNIIFRLKAGINFNPEDVNYDLFQLALRVAAKRLNPSFSFMDSSFNAQYGDQVAYMGCRSRVMANRHGETVTDGRGNLSFTTINLPRLGIRAQGDLDQFWQLLNKQLKLVFRQLHHRFQVQAKLKVKDMPFIMGQKLYLGSEKLKFDDPIETVIKQGTLTVGFIGLAETLASLIGEHHGESAAAQKAGLEIVAFMRQKTDQACEEFDLNYTLLATPAEGLSGRFVKMDAKEYGQIPGVTDKDYYTNSFHVPVKFAINAFEKIKIEGLYHQYCNAGHISYVELSSPPVHNLSVMEDIIRFMGKSDMGYTAINFPVDFCSGCNFLGVIDQDTCPQCGAIFIRRIHREGLDV